MSKILQFKITLNDSQPKIWRRFQMADSSTFYDLHRVIQKVMGWTNSHLYQFIFEGNRYIGNPELVDYKEIVNDADLRLLQIFDKPKIKMRYEYDFGDGWMHDIVLEKILPDKPGQQYPWCLAGEMNCPPEDCGGIHYFYHRIEVLKDKKHPEYKEMVQWMGDDYDPEEFDLDFVNHCLANLNKIDISLN